jgi:hypothetical protein
MFIPSFELADAGSVVQVEMVRREHDLGDVASTVCPPVVTR